ncbi:MAG: TRAP transporter large permease subunit, partial [Arenibacterium sp.]
CPVFYFSLAVFPAPGGGQAGINDLWVFFFILYGGVVRFITPPVALGAFAAATMAGASAMRTGFEAMRLGGVIYITPFFFVLNPALIGQGEPGEVIFVLAWALVGVWFISSAFQGYVSFVGNMGSSALALVMRVVLFFSGLMVAAPTGGVAGLSHVALTITALLMSLFPLAFAWRNGKEPTPNASA